ncbi:MAG: hypothetical protein HC793_04595 [Aquincola sp.]|nr:hypothetical protein [Aquincola sp.]
MQSPTAYLWGPFTRFGLATALIVCALDQALKGDRSAKAAEPSFADLVSDTARRATG